jgi:hypothetical protein
LHGVLPSFPASSPITPPLRRFYVPHNRLPAGVHVDVLHGDLLLALAAIALQRLQLLMEHAQQLGGIAGRSRIIGVEEWPRGRCAADPEALRPGVNGAR